MIEKGMEAKMTWSSTSGKNKTYLIPHFHCLLFSYSRIMSNKGKVFFLSDEPFSSTLTKERQCPADGMRTRNATAGSGSERRQGVTHDTILIC
jgi:hypothetical protein